MPARRRVRMEPRKLYITVSSKTELETKS